MYLLWPRQDLLIVPEHCLVSSGVNCLDPVVGTLVVNNNKRILLSIQIARTATDHHVDCAVTRTQREPDAPCVITILVPQRLVRMHEPVLHAAEGAIDEMDALAARLTMKTFIRCAEDQILDDTPTTVRQLDLWVLSSAFCSHVADLNAATSR